MVSGSGERPVAAVLDASLFDKGKFRTQSVSRLAQDLGKRGFELWIPRQIVFEWAAHAKPDVAALRTTYKAAQDAGLVAAQELPSSDAADLAEAIERVCRAIPNVTVLEMTGDAAIAGIRDQILGTGPGSVDAKVRTGASDSSWVRDALARVEGPGRVVFASRNGKDIWATTTAMGHAEAQVKVWNGSRQTFDEFFPYPQVHPEPAIDAHTAQRVVATYLLSLQADSWEADDRHGPPPEWIAVDDVAVGSDERASRDDIENLLEPEAVLAPGALLIDVGEVSVEADGEDTLVSYTVRLFADVRVEGRVFDNDGNTLFDSVTMFDRVVRVPFRAVLRDETVLDIEQVGAAEHSAADRRFRDTYDAYQWLRFEELDDWEFITVSDLDGEDGVKLLGPGRQTETATLFGDLGGDWELSFERTGATVTATYDADSRVWLGKHDSFDLYPPVGLSSQVPGARRAAVGPYVALAAVWAHLITGAADEDDQED
ncbi:hypothetical protein [Mycolicibacterium iranicum]|uniref:DUF4935 domain-containing protein n=1 Tax=Mycolicibacterium iranicum TaxID=912594 RepID=A0ABT4HLN9_MYCIR|nr:hypothetical protein [Mycolicibacterium iranicum]MCZ0730664.1 hypothetical protein [Mycolicibacterium iranicum]